MKLLRVLHLQCPCIDPALFIERFASQMQLSDKTQSVTSTGVRLTQAMNRDWISTGRRPSGLCGAALLISARYHGFKVNPEDIVNIVRISSPTLQKRLGEFKLTSTARVPIQDFENTDLLALPIIRGPPCLEKRLEKERKDKERLLAIENGRQQQTAIEDERRQVIKAKGKSTKGNAHQDSDDDELPAVRSTSSRYRRRARVKSKANDKSGRSTWVINGGKPSPSEVSEESDATTHRPSRSSRSRSSRWIWTDPEASEGDVSATPSPGSTIRVGGTGDQSETEGVSEVDVRGVVEQAEMGDSSGLKVNQTQSTLASESDLLASLMTESPTSAQITTIAARMLSTIQSGTGGSGITSTPIPLSEQNDTLTADGTGTPQQPSVSSNAPASELESRITCGAEASEVVERIGDKVGNPLSGSAVNEIDDDPLGALLRNVGEQADSLLPEMSSAANNKSTAIVLYGDEGAKREEGDDLLDLLGGSLTTTTTTHSSPTVKPLKRLLDKASVETGQSTLNHLKNGRLKGSDRERDGEGRVEETLSDVDDGEIEHFLLGDEEKAAKAMLWDHVTKDVMVQVRRRDVERKKREQAAAAGGKDRVKRRRSNLTGVHHKAEAPSAAESVMISFESKGIGSKLNTDVLQELFG
eukprot:GHVN01058732.1.p1 GENE.GHVN01058732.1~~GHVN01058732.1.p1  ORF type:complete len:641 (-),score=173.38 GHVN01058732.1:1047-2969(-)